MRENHEFTKKTLRLALSIIPTSWRSSGSTRRRPLVQSPGAGLIPVELRWFLSEKPVSVSLFLSFLPSWDGWVDLFFPSIKLLPPCRFPQNLYAFSQVLEDALKNTLTTAPLASLVTLRASYEHLSSGPSACMRNAFVYSRELAPALHVNRVSYFLPLSCLRL